MSIALALSRRSEAVRTKMEAAGERGRAPGFWSSLSSLRCDLRRCAGAVPRRRPSRRRRGSSPAGPRRRTRQKRGGPGPRSSLPQARSLVGERHECCMLRSFRCFDACRRAPVFHYFVFAASLRATKNSLASLEGPQSGKEREGDGEKTGFVFSMRCASSSKTRRKKWKKEEKTFFCFAKPFSLSLSLFLFISLSLSLFSPSPSLCLKQKSRN